jgi:PTS system N-acetylglucosamine-specific IIC component
LPLPACAILLVVWPLIFRGFIAFGEWIVGLGYVGAGIYAFFNRLLIPFGLHHALNNVFWFDTIGLGDLTHFWAGDVTGQNGVTWDLGIYMSGFFPCMMFGIPGAAIAIWRNAEPKRKKQVASLMFSAALCAFICGVTEPFEFAFMFACFPLYIIYAALYFLFTIITCVSGFRAGFSFSAGLTDLIFSASLPAAQKTWMIIPLGIAAFVVFFLVFDFCIKKFNFMTPGRGNADDDIDNPALSNVPKAASADNDFAEIAAGVLAGIGGKDNVDSVDFCVTRLRFVLKDDSLVDQQAVKAVAPLGMIKPAKNAVQVIIGTQVQHVYDELQKMLK